MFAGLRSLSSNKYATRTHRLEPMIFDDELKRLAIEAYTENQENPATELIHLSNIEREYKELIDNSTDLEELQKHLETRSQEYLTVQRKNSEARLTHQGHGSQVRVGRAIRNKLVPGLPLRLKELHQSALTQRSGRHYAVIKPILAKIDDYDVIAHITLTCVLDGVGRGAAMSTPLTTVYQQIGERVDHECFLRHVKETDPNGWERGVGSCNPRSRATPQRSKRQQA